MARSQVTDPDWLCDNWSCPARASCARHFGRSVHYYKMTDPMKLPPSRTPKVEEGEDDCEHYRRDEARPWLMREWGLTNGEQHIPMGDHGWMRL